MITSGADQQFPQQLVWALADSPFPCHTDPSAVAQTRFQAQMSQIRIENIECLFKNTAIQKVLDI